jgi:hypothetical protein
LINKHHHLLSVLIAMTKKREVNKLARVSEQPATLFNAVKKPQQSQSSFTPTA